MAKMSRPRAAASSKYVREIDTTNEVSKWSSGAATAKGLDRTQLFARAPDEVVSMGDELFIRTDLAVESGDPEFHVPSHP